jgi:hypothetical protein
LIQNLGNHDAYLSVQGGAPTVGGGFLLAKNGGSLEFVHWIPQFGINGIATLNSDVEILYVGT